MTLTLGLTLLAWYAAPIMVLILGVWAWIVSTIYDKDAARHYLPRTQWNIVHLAAGGLAAAAMLFVPLPFFITVPIAIAVLFADLAAYFVFHNKDERVADAFKWSTNPVDWFAKAAEGKQRGKKEKVTKGITMSFAGASGKLGHPQPETPEFAVRVAAEEIIGAAATKRASRVEIGPVKDGVYGAIATVDGLKMPIKQMPANEAGPVLDFFKQAAGLQLEERRKKQRGKFSFGFGESATTDARVTTMGSSRGQVLTMLLDPEAQVDFRVESLGLLKPQLDVLRQMVSSEGGVVLLATPPGHGATSLMNAMMRAHDAYTSNIQILEYETLKPLEGIRHNIFDPQEGGEFSTVARSLLRRDPDVIGIADLPDAETAQVIARADHSHMRVYVTMTSADPLAAVQQYAKLVGDAKLAADSLSGVMGGRLMRRLCDNCRIPYKPTPEMLQKLGLPADVQNLYRTEGKVMVKDRPETCPVCGGSGYTGQVGAFAVHPIGAEERAFIAQSDWASLRGSWRQKKQPGIQTAALQSLVKGDTTVDELVRVLQGGGKKNPKQEAKGEPKPAAAGS